MAIGILVSLKHFFNLGKGRRREQILSRRAEIAILQEQAVAALVDRDFSYRTLGEDFAEDFRNIVGNIDWIFLEKKLSFEFQGDWEDHRMRIKGLRKKLADIGVEVGYSPDMLDRYVEEGYTKFSVAGFGVWLERFATIKNSPQDKIKSLIIEANEVLLEYLRDEHVCIDLFVLDSIERSLT